LREIITRTHRQTALIDHRVGRLPIALQEAGRTEGTLLIHVPNHGGWRR
jgi:hypothetical protein